MFYLPATLLLFLALLLLPFVWFTLTIDIVEIAVAKLGFSQEVAVLLFVAVMVGSVINIPLYRRVSVVDVVPDAMALWLRQFWGIPLQKVQQETVVALNVGGGLIPTGLALFELSRSNPLLISVVTAIVTVVSYYSAHVVPGIGIQMNALAAPLTASFTAVLLAGAEAPSIAFAGGVLGTLIGADLLHLSEIEQMTPGVLSIGGAGFNT